MTRLSTDSESILRELHRSLDERWRPEEVAQKVLSVLDVLRSEERTIRKAARAGRSQPWSSMSRDFDRPQGMRRQLAVAEELFGTRVDFAPDDVKAIEQWLQKSEQSIAKEYGRSDFKHDRLSKAERLRAGVDISRRQYNKRFRLAVRLEKKAQRLVREQFKRSLTLAGKSRLASQIVCEDFCSDANSACFIAYFTARCNLRSVFTNTRQVRPYDEICETLMQRCHRSADRTNWWAIAHVYPHPTVLKHLDDRQKGVLLGEFFNMLHQAAEFLRDLWESNEFTRDMVVQPGNDSTTWNLTAGAWNRLRDGWFALMYSLGLEESVEQICPGKVLRLMAADVAWWHRESGGSIHPDTLVWQQLPRPWEVLSEESVCPRHLVESVCRKHGIDPVTSGWTAPKPDASIERFTPTPELVHGVVVSSPELAAVFRKAGIFSGQASKSDVPPETVDEIRRRHRRQQEERRRRIEQTARE